MAHISAVVTLRPIRFAFLVKPNDSKRLLEIFQINTCLWGGKFNPIIPIFGHVPKWWDRDDYKPESALQIVNGYLDAFEPDFLVEAEAGLAKGFGYDPDRVLQLSAMLRRSDELRGQAGLDVFDLYKDLYKKQFQFVRRHEHNIVELIPRTNALKLFCACLSGSFPEDEDLKYFGQGFCDAFDPKQVELSPEALVDLYKDGFNSALQIGHSNIEVNYHDNADPTLFVMDAHDSRDLIDFWNLRAMRKYVRPIPLQWIDALSPYCREYIEDCHRPVRGNQFGLMTHATVMFARSIPTANIEQLYADYLRVNQDEANRRQDWYPPIWRPSSGFTVRSTRPTLSCAEKTFDTQIEGDRTEVRFDYLHPEFTERYGANDARWVNVVKLKNWSNTSRAATVYPCNYRSPKMPRFQSIQRSILSTTEGFVVFCRFHNMSDLWRLSDGTTAISEWLKNNGVESQISDAGQATQQIINTLGGFRGISSFAHAEIVKLLNKISRRPISPSIQHQEFQNKINNVVKGDIWRNKNAETLVELGAVELGLELKCAKCSTWGWHALRELDLVVACGLCLNKFSFPMIDPSSSQLSRWAYRLIGPFALPDYARGGYAASLTLRFLANTFGNHDATITWSTGQILTLAPKQYIEADLILWHRRKVFNELDHHAELVFGEAKSFRGENSEEKKAVADAFEVEDVERMKQLAIRFPGAILVFATMKQAGDLSPAEIQRITKLASWGREYIHERRQTRAPVILLTGLELFAPYSLSQAWDAAGGRHAEMGKGHFGYTDNLRVLADMTQQLYLNMPAYSEWLRAKWEKRNQRRQVRQAAAVPARDAGDH
ncbi:hypothetical protein [Enterobacter huaxiensis]|uniref:Uncharacterized protein n=2 Tax=Enterobacteriaceae TaxID=543 RepID=A0ABU6ETS1_9ENTR|nr:hypothetical protein [Enterobacter huaxiensis]MEB7544120.1 hypothetical protein [Enterobacter huaxiensis]MEB7581898.1 hypothetical protein [Enterobacter huaxiensis]MEB7664299.1 hypothetical protein [Enterobacter huaxiensis]